VFWGRAWSIYAPPGSSVLGRTSGSRRKTRKTNADGFLLGSQDRCTLNTAIQSFRTITKCLLVSVPPKSAAHLCPTVVFACMDST